MRYETKGSLQANTIPGMISNIKPTPTITATSKLANTALE
jgi:hypothetical protein